MDLKPIVTNFGDEKLFNHLSKEIERRLPSKSVVWKRIYGRTSKTVFLKATFTKFNSDQLGGTSDGTVSKQPFLHLYWTSCMENDEFRNGTKQKIINWQEHLKARDITDWLIIQVVSLEGQRSARNKITLPRSSVFDKIKNDLCGKNSSRVAQLWEPTKETLFTKSGESWEALLAQLRQLLLDSISRHLAKFEEKVRHQREKYAEPNWSFIEYLKLNEELATIFKSVTLHEDALVQYDELDALFSQFVVNSKIKGLPSWMEPFTKTPSSWDGISLQKQAVKYYKDVVYEGEPSLLELRNYIFLRQWQMLIKINKSWDVAHRLLEFLFTVVNEMKILLTGLSSCVPACWVVSSCLEYINFVEQKEISNQAVMACLAQLLDYARDKLFFIGKACNLLPGEQPVDGIVEELAAGLGKNIQTKEESEHGSKLLLKAICSQSHFNKLYLRICGRTKSLYQNVGRYRFANRVGVDIANFYLMKEKYDSAEKQLTIALQEYRQCKWKSLYIDVLEPLATCQAKLNSFDRYLCSLAALSCASTLSEEKRLQYADMFLDSVNKEADHLHTIATEPVITLDHVDICLTKEIGHIGEIVTVNLTLRNNLLRQIRLEEIEVRMRYTETDNVRLSEVDSGFNTLKRNSNEVSWSEIFSRPEEESSPSTPKSTIFQRIKSRRSAKQRENRGSTEDSTDTGHDRESESMNEAANVLKRGPLNQIVEDLASDEGTSGLFEDEKPKTLAEIARDLRRSMSIGEESCESGSDVSSQPIAIPNGGLNCRCDSSASSLSVVSISSDKDGSVVGSIPKNERLNSYPSLLHRQKLMSSLNGRNKKSHSDQDFRKDDSNLDQCGNDEIEVSSREVELDSDVGIEMEAHLNEDILDGAEKSNTECDGNDNNSENELKAIMDGKIEEDKEHDMQPDYEGFSTENMEGKLSRGFNSVSDEANDCLEEDSSVDNETDTRQSDKDDVFQSGFEEDLDIPSEIEEETAPTKSLTSGVTCLENGENIVKVTAKIMHVGRYNLQTLRCRIGNVILFKVLDLPRKSRAFFIVSDPPKFNWTSNHLAECLLLGNKQRIHITLSNGPGAIAASSVVQLSSATGLQFSPVPPSSVMVYSPNQKDDPKEGAMQIEVDSSKKNEANMYLPYCGPYEMSDLYFDVTAPAENVDLFGHMARHEITLNCLWLSDLIDAKTNLESIFYEPFNVDHENLYSTAGNYIRTTLKNLNPLQIDIVNPVLLCLNSDEISFSCMTCDIQMCIHANEELSLIWHVIDANQVSERPHTLVCQLQVNFKTEDQEELGGFSKQFEVANVRHVLAITTTVNSGKEDPLLKGAVYPIEVTIKSLGKLPLSYHNGKIFCKIVDNDSWKYEDETECRKCELQGNDFEFSFITKAFPCQTGKLRHPRIELSRMIEHHNDVSQDDPSHPRKHRMGSGVTKEKLSSSRRTSASTSDEIAHSFVNGEILYTESGRYIDIMQPQKQETTV